MKIVMIGSGYVGLVSGACFAEFGNKVTCIDVDKSKSTALGNGEIGIYEPSLEQLVQKIFVKGISYLRKAIPTHWNRQILFLSL